MYAFLLYSPVKQVGTHTYRLSKVLKENGINVWVNNAVFFSKMGTSVNIQNKNGEEMHVYTNNQSNELLCYLRREDNKKLTENDINKILNILA